MAKRPEDRFQSAEELLAKLERVLQDVVLENSRSRARRWAVLAGTTLVALGAVVWLTAAPTGLARVIATEVGRRLRSPGSPAAIRSLVILPIVDASASHEGPSFGDTLTEALTTELGRTKGLRVIARGPAVRSATDAPAEIGRDLKVDALLQGTVQRSADRIRVELRLVSTASGEPVWTERFEESATDMLALQARASRGVRSALVLRPDGEPGLVPQRVVRNPEAYDLYLRAKIRARQESDSDVSAAIGLLEKAVRLDPEFAAAQAELSHAYGLRVAQFAPNDALALERAELAAEKALRLDPDLAESHYAAGQLLWGVVKNRFWAERAVREFKRALALNPNLDEVHHHLGQVYLHIGLLDQAVAELEKTLDLQPADNNAIRRIGITLIYRGQYEEGLRTIRQVPPQSNASLWHYQVAWALLYLGRNQEAWTLMEQYLRAHPEDRGGVVTSTRAIWFAKAGDVRRAEEDIRTAVDKGKGFIHFHHSAYNIASAYALLGQAGPAVQWLRTAAETGWPCYPYFANDPNLERIHGDPGYETFIRDLKAQWEQYQLTL
jgi:TolB-like protein/Flp pilus assembly protein TadD